jgi:hypothetical protein
MPMIRSTKAARSAAAGDDVVVVAVAAIASRPQKTPAPPQPANPRAAARRASQPRLPQVAPGTWMKKPSTRSSLLSSGMSLRALKPSPIKARTKLPQNAAQAAGDAAVVVVAVKTALRIPSAPVAMHPAEIQITVAKQRREPTPRTIPARSKRANPGTVKLATVMVDADHDRPAGNAKAM